MIEIFPEFAGSLHYHSFHLSGDTDVTLGANDRWIGNGTEFDGASLLMSGLFGPSL